MPFFFDDSFGVLSESDTVMVREKLKEFEGMTCVKLVEVRVRNIGLKKIIGEHVFCSIRVFNTAAALKNY